MRRISGLGKHSTLLKFSGICALGLVSACSVGSIYSSSFNTNNNHNNDPSIVTKMLYPLTRHKAMIAAAPTATPVQTVQTKRHNDSNSRAPCPEWDYNWDNRNLKSKCVRNYILVRHGQYGGIKKQLTQLGKEQAKITGEKLKSLNIKFDQILCSKLIRAQETLDIILNQLYDETLTDDMDSIKNIVQYDSDLNEGAPSRVIPIWQSLEENGFYNNLDKDSKRISDAFEKYIHRSDSDEKKVENILIVGHGNVFRYFVCRLLQFPDEAWLRLAIANCSITGFHIRGDGIPSVHELGSNTHFPKDKLTFC